MTNVCKDYLNYWRYALNTTEEASRSEYWFPTLAHVAFFSLLMAADKENYDTEPGDQFIPTPINKLYTAFAVLSYIPTYSVFSRRLNHLGMSQSIAKLIYSANALGYIYVYFMNKKTHKEIEAIVGGRNNFAVLASIVAVAYTSELVLALKK